MALTFRIYRSNVIGDGLTPQTAFRSALTRYIQSGNGADFWDWIHEARPIRYSLARCDSTVHTLIEADPDITPISGEFTDWQAWLSLTAASIPLATRNLLESDGFAVGWANSQTTRRQALIYVSRVHVMMQVLRRLGDNDPLQVFAQGLDTTIGSLPQIVRTKVGNWMNNRGLDTTWIIGSTTVRQVIQYLMESYNWPILSFGPHSF